jgi:hypothetical protein
MTLTILVITHRPDFQLKYNVSDAGVCFCLQVEPTQLDPIARASLCVRTARPEDGDRIKPPKCCVLNKSGR